MRRVLTVARLAVRAAIICVAGIGAGACGAGSADSAAASADVAVTVDTVGGVVQVRNEGRPPAWSLEDVVTIGTAGGASASPDEFGRISGLVADDDGLVYVADAIATEIRVFDESGELVRRIGRQGGGPGEFEALQSIGWLGDRLLALDPRNGRIGLLSPEGEWLGQRPYMAITGTGMRVYPTGRAEAYSPFARIGDGGAERLFVRQTPEGPADTLSNPSSDETSAVRVLCTHAGGQGISSYGATFAPRMLRVPAPGVRRADAWTAAHRITFTSAAGDTVRVVERDLPPLTVTDADWRDEEAAFEEFLEGIPGADCDPPRLPRPEAMEMIRAIVFDGAGRMWVERRTDDGSFALDAFDADGRLLGSVPVPDRLERVPPYVRGDRLYLVVTDELDVEYVRVFEIREDGAV